MTDENTQNQPPPTESKGETPLREGWHRPLPLELPEPTYWPAVLSLGITFLLWGVVTTWIISAVGLVLSILALTGWIRDVLRQQSE